MISIRKNITELDESHHQRDLALDCYLAAVRNVSHYAIEFEASVAKTHRLYLTTLSEEIATATPEILTESRGTLRGLLRDYRDKASRYLAELREQLASTANALQETVASLAQTDGDSELRLRSAVASLRQVAQSPEAAPLRSRLGAAADTIQQSIDQAKREHQITVSQFQTEIRMLHKRIDMLETAACLDSLTKMFTRREMEDRIRQAPPGGCSLLLIKVTGFRLAELNFNREVAAELTTAFSQRLRNSLPEGALIGRWSDEEFLVVTQLPKAEAVNLARHIGDHLAGSYACLLAGRSVHPDLQLRVGTVDGTGETPERILQKIGEILTGK